MEKRIRTNAEIDTLNQFLSEGETPIPYETQEDNSNENSGEQNQDDAEKIKADADAAQKILDDANAEKENGASEKEEKKPEIIEAELDDEKVLAYIKNKKGKEVSSLDEFLNPKKELTPEEIKAQAEQRDANKIAYGLSKGIFTKNHLEEFITDTKNPKDLVFAAYAADQKAKDADLTDAEIEEEFEEKFGLNEDKESRKFKAGQNLINIIADNIISKKHSKILNLDTDFTSHETAQLQQKELEAKILTQAPIYKKEIEEVRKEIKSISIPISKDENFETELDDDVVEEIISQMLDNKYSETQIRNGWNKDAIKQVAQTTGIIKQLPKILKAYADKIVLDKQAGIRGIPPNSKEAGRHKVETELTQRQKDGLAYIDQMLPQPQVAN